MKTILQDVTVERAQEEELSEILKLWLEAAHWLMERGIMQWKPGSFNQNSILEHFHKTELFAARWEGRIVGSFSVQWSDEPIWQALNDTTSGYIHRLVVARQFKGTGMGNYLLTWAEQYIQRAGRNCSRLDCMADNERLNRFYQDAGYEYIRRIDWKYWSASLYEKMLS